VTSGDGFEAGGMSFSMGWVVSVSQKPSFSSSSERLMTGGRDFFRDQILYLTALLK